MCARHMSRTGIPGFLAKSRTDSGFCREVPKQKERGRCDQLHPRASLVGVREHPMSTVTRIEWPEVLCATGALVWLLRFSTAGWLALHGRETELLARGYQEGLFGRPEFFEGLRREIRRRIVRSCRGDLSRARDHADARAHSVWAFRNEANGG